MPYICIFPLVAKWLLSREANWRYFWKTISSIVCMSEDKRICTTCSNNYYRSNRWKSADSKYKQLPLYLSLPFQEKLGDTPNYPCIFHSLPTEYRYCKELATQGNIQFLRDMHTPNCLSVQIASRSAWSFYCTVLCQHYRLWELLTRDKIVSIHCLGDLSPHQTYHSQACRAISKHHAQAVFDGLVLRLLHCCLRAICLFIHFDL